MKTYSQTQRNYINEGANQDQLLRTHIKTMLGVIKTKVQSKRHTIISGPPGIGKSFSTMDEIAKANINYMQFGAGSTDSAIALELAHGVSQLGAGEELVVLLDDADDVVFRDYETANKFKFAMAKYNPFYAQDVNLTTARNKYERAGRMDLVQAIDAFSVPGKVGIHIPTDQVRFYIVCNRDCEDPKQFTKKIFNAVEAIVDRTKYKRLDFEWRVAWGWLAHILDNNQPFEDYPLTDDQKRELAGWVWDKWPNMRNQSYRTIEEMAEYMINNPDGYEDEWTATFIKSSAKKAGL
jgi:hypothetical protein